MPTLSPTCPTPATSAKRQQGSKQVHFFPLPSLIFYFFPIQWHTRASSNDASAIVLVTMIQLKPNIAPKNCGDLLKD